MSIPSPPPKIAKYTVQGILGSGAMGVVYKALDEQIDRPVAVKVLHEHLRLGADGETLAVRFLQEARAAARCLHPNIVTIFDFGNEGVPYIVMEYVEGIELRTFLRSSVTLPLADAVNIALQVLDALAFAHSRGVVHRDIKPENIILLQDGTVKVSDFGVARMDTSDLTGTGFMIGTPSYMSPEGLQGKHVDGRSDLYSVGVVLFEMICGQRFDREISVRQNLEKIKRELSVSKFNIERIWRILASVLQTSPENRFQKASEFIQELRQLENIDTSATVVLSRPMQDLQATRIMEQPKLIEVDAWDGELLQSLEQSLTTYVGPVAKHLLRKCLRNTGTVDALIEQLAVHIPTEMERSQFKTAARRSGITSLYPSVGGSTSKTGSGIAEEDREILELREQQVSPAKQAAVIELLAFYTGPIAQRLVHKYLPRSAGVEQLAEVCASHIVDVKERQQFLDKVAKL